MTDAGNAPSWLFSFVDLAFLMLIAMTQLASDQTGPELGDIIVPKIEQSATESRPTSAAEFWQLRIHPVADDGTPVFELVHSTQPESGVRLTIDALPQELEALKSQGVRRPLLAPHEESRSQDLLDAVAALETRWPGRRRASVIPRMAAK